MPVPDRRRTFKNGPLCSPAATRPRKRRGLRPAGTTAGAEVSAVVASAPGAAHRQFEALPVILNFSPTEHADGRVTVDEVSLVRAADQAGED